MQTTPADRGGKRRLHTLEPDAIEQRLGRLMRHYLHSRSPAIAQSVVRHIETLCAHPAYTGDNSERCVYLRLRAHWRWLAHTPVTANTGGNPHV